MRTAVRPLRYSLIVLCLTAFLLPSSILAASTSLSIRAVTT